MNSNQHYLRSTINEIIFEHRNKSYGAYYLRTHQSQYLLRALAFGALLVGMFAIYALQTNREQVEEKIRDIVVTVDKIPQLDLPDLTPVKPKTPEPPVSQPVAQPEIKYTEMRVVDDAKPIKSDITAVADLKDKVISTKTNDLPPGIKGSVVQHTTTTPEVKTNNAPVDFAEQAPEFIGGFAAMQQYIANNIDYPNMARSNDIEGIVYVSMVINTDGSVSDVKLVRGIGYGCDEAAMEVVAAMPKWEPGMQNKQLVRVRTVIPINFELSND